jgi:hypothetical protein
MYRKILDICGIIALVIIAVALILLTVAVYSNKFNSIVFWGGNPPLTAETPESTSPPASAANDEENDDAK